MCSTANCSSCPNDLCTSCSTIQLTANNLITCVDSCPSGTFLQSTTNTCITCSSQCLACTSATQCTSCATDYSLYVGYCLSSCPSGHTDVNGICTACLSGCKVCVSIDNCTACNSGLTDNNNGSCSLSNSTSSVNCSNGYYLNTLGNCSQCYPTCQTCSGALSSNCLTCFNGSLLTNGICVH